MKTTEGKRVRAHSLTRNTLGVTCWSSRMGTKKIDKQFNYSHRSTQTKQPWINTDSQDSPWLELGGSHHLSPYSILYAWPRGQHPNGILSQDSHLGVSKFSKFLKLGLLQLWRPITLHEDLRSKWGLKQSRSPHQELSNEMWHATCTQGNPCDYRLLMTGSQIANLTPGPSFGHNLCLKCLNGSCKPILDIYVLRAFQLYNEILNPMGFDPCNLFLKIWESIGTLTPKVGAHLRV